jgi:hypothetical protein
LAHLRGIEESIPKQLGISSGNTEAGTKDTRLMPAAGVFDTKTVVPQFGEFHDNIANLLRQPFALSLRP